MRNTPLLLPPSRGRPCGVRAPSEDREGHPRLVSMVQAREALRAEGLAMASPLGIRPTEEEVERLCDAAALALGRGEVPGCLGAID